jgi:hypothetical protein
MKITNIIAIVNVEFKLETCKLIISISYIIIFKELQKSLQRVQVRTTEVEVEDCYSFEALNS